MDHDRFQRMTGRRSVRRWCLVALAALVAVGVAQRPAPKVDLVTAVAVGDVAAVRQHLLAKPNLNLPQAESEITPLMAACLYWRTEIGRLLLSKRLDPNLADAQGSTALHMAAFFGHADLVRILLEKGADPEIRNKRRESPLDTVAGPWSDELRGIYEYLARELKLELDLERVRKARPEIAGILRGHAQGQGGNFNATVPREPLDPSSNPYWQERINRDRLYDYYAKQAIHFGSLDPEQRPAIFPQFPGLDGRAGTHFGNQSDANWRDGRANRMDFGSMVSGTFRGGDRVLPRAVCVSLGDGYNAVYNTNTQCFVEAWRGDLVRWSDVRRGMQNGLYVGSERTVELKNGPISPEAQFLGIHRQGERVVFAYRKGGKTFFKTAVVEEGVVVEKFLREAEATKPGDAQWPERLKTMGVLGDHQPYAIDTLTLPYNNPWKSLMFLGGIDFVSESRIAVSTLYGDVWVCDVLGEDLGELRWKRFASGLYQPLGLKVVDGVIHVMCRDMLVALRDLNGDDEADFYECVSNRHVTSTGGHDYVTNLQRDSAGPFYIASAAQGVCRVSPGGKELEVLATGLRYPNGLAVNRDGSVMLASLQEGNWTPASAIVEVVEGGHCGFGGGRRRGRSATCRRWCFCREARTVRVAGRIFIDSDRWGPQEGNWVHFSVALARHFLILREVIDGRSQAAAFPLWGEFLSGSHRGRMSPFDGQLYVAGAQGYLNYGTKDGSLQRVRFTGGAYHYPSKYETRGNGILLTFDEPQPEDLAKRELWFAQQWNYRLTPDYGSDEYSVKEPNRTGHDSVEIRSVHRLEGGRVIFLEIPQLKPVNQLHLYYQGSEAKSRPLEVFATVHRLGAPFTNFPGYERIAKAGGSATWSGPVPGQVAATIAACTTCHHPTERVVGPPLSEIRQRYANNPSGIVKWAMNPENTTPDTPPMPSFQFVGEENLLKIAQEILAGE